MNRCPRNRHGGRHHYWREATYGSFRRLIPLPIALETHKAEAVYKKSVLTVTLPKPLEAQKKRKLIPVRAN